MNTSSDSQKYQGKTFGEYRDDVLLISIKKRFLEIK